MAHIGEPYESQLWAVRITLVSCTAHGCDSITSCLQRYDLSGTPAIVSAYLSVRSFLLINICKSVFCDLIFASVKKLPKLFWHCLKRND